MSEPRVAPMSSHLELTQANPREEDLPPAVMPMCAAHKVLAGPKALVTGANSGTGQAAALSLVRASAAVAVSYVPLYPGSQTSG